MKKVLFLLLVIFSIVGVSGVFAQDVKTASFRVSGNCNMCKKRIEKAALIDGVNKCDWNVQSKVMTVSYDASKTNAGTIQQKIAAAGHDTEMEKATDESYNNLPGCCQYERRTGNRATTHTNYNFK